MTSRHRRVRNLRRLIALTSALAGSVLIAPAASAQVINANSSDDSVVEHDGAESWFDVTRSPPDGVSTVEYDVVNGTAIFPNDYGTAFDTGVPPGPASDGNQDDGVLTFADGVSVLRVRVPVVNDSLFESDEDLFVNLSDPTNATIGDAQGRAVIVNDDPAPPPTACNAACVQQLGGLITALSNGKGLFGKNSAITKMLVGMLAKTIKQFGVPLYLFPGHIQILIATTPVSTFPFSATAAKKPVQILTANQTTGQAGEQEVVFTLTSAGKKFLKKAKKSGKRLNLTLQAAFTDLQGQTVTYSAQFKVKPPKD